MARSHDLLQEIMLIMGKCFTTYKGNATERKWRACLLGNPSSKEVVQVLSRYQPLSAFAFRTLWSRACALADYKEFLGYQGKGRRAKPLFQLQEDWDRHLPVLRRWQISVLIESPPFSFVGVDCLVRYGSGEAEVKILRYCVCLVTRAIHIEVFFPWVTSLQVEMSLKLWGQIMARILSAPENRELREAISE